MATKRGLQPAGAAILCVLLLGCATTSESDTAPPVDQAQPAGSALHWEEFLDDAAGLDTVAVASKPQSPVRDSGRRFMTKCVGHGDVSVLLISGYMTPMANWEDVQAKIGSLARVCAYDRLGIGRSRPLPPRQTFESFAVDADRLIDALHLQRPVVVVGHSLGGPIAMTWVTSHPQDTAGVVLVDAPDAGFNQWQSEVMTEADKAKFGDPLAPASGDPEHFDATTAYGQLTRLPTLGDRPMMVLTHDPTHPEGVESGMSGVAPGEETREAWLQAQARWAEFSDISELVTVDGTGHFIQTQDPDAVVAAILATMHAAN